MKQKYSVLSCFIPVVDAIFLPCLSITVHVLIVFNHQRQAQLIHFITKTEEKEREVSTESKCHEPFLMSCCDENMVCPLNPHDGPQASFYHQNKVVLYNRPFKSSVSVFSVACLLLPLRLFFILSYLRVADGLSTQF